MVCVFGQTSDPDYKICKYDASKLLSKLVDRKNVATVLCLSQKDRFGLSFLEMTATTEPSELLSSHSFLRARSQILTVQDALRSILLVEVLVRR
jgi:hypothetical protein